jgi:hypothetical protein
VFGWPDPNTGFDQSEYALYTCYFIAASSKAADPNFVLWVEFKIFYLAHCMTVSVTFNRGAARSGIRQTGNVIIFHLWSSFMESHSWLKVIKQQLLGAFSITRRCFRHYTGTFAIIRDGSSIIRDAFAIIRGAFTIHVRGAFAIIRSGSSIIRGAFNIIREKGLFMHFVIVINLCIYK